MAGRNLFADSPVSAETVSGGRNLFAQQPVIQQEVDAGQVQPIEQATSQEQTAGEFAGGAGQSLLQGATMGFSDEIQAAIAATVASPFVSDQTFSQLMLDARKSLRADQDKFRKENPATAIGLELAGGALTGGAGLARAGVKQGLAKTIAKGAGTGAAVGTAAGAGFADEDEFLSTGTLEKAGTGGATGLALAGLAPLGIRAFTESGKLISKKAPRALLESAFKIRPSVKPADRANMIETTLREGIMPTVSGLSKIANKLTVLNTSLDDIIDSATAGGKTIPKNVLFRELRVLRKELGGAKLDAGTDLNNIDAVAKAFNKQLISIKKDRLTPREVQDLKTDAYKRINFDLSQGKGNFAKNETRKAIARSAKEALEDIDPAIKATNQRTGDLLQLNKEMERIVTRLDNRNLISLDTAVKIGAGAATGVPAGQVAGVGAAVFGAPRVKARTALILENIRLMSETSKITGSLPPELQGAMGVLIGRAQSAMNEQISGTEE